jgi:O-antigen/teichoic acid export membrane protein
VSKPGRPDTLADEHVGPRVVRGGFQRAAGFVVRTALSVAAAVVLLRYLGVDEFGQYGVVMALVNIVYGISDAGLTVTGARELALEREPGDRHDVLANVLSLRILLTGVGVVAAIAFAVVAGYASELVLGVTLAGFGIFLASVQAALILPLTVDLRNAALAFNEVFHQALLFAGFAVLAALGAGLVPFFAAHILFGLALLALAPFLLRPERLAVPGWSRERMRQLIRIGLPIALANALGVLYVRLLVILMSLLSDSETEIGYFVTTTRVVELLAGLPFLFGAVILPVLTVAARDDRDRMDYMTARMTQTMALAGVLIALFSALAAYPIIVTLGGEEYAGAVPALQIQCLGVVAMFIAASWNQALIGMGDVKPLAVIIVAGTVTVLVAGSVLIPQFEAKGAAYTALLADVVLCAGAYLAARRAGPARSAPLGTLLRIAVAAMPAIGVGLIPGLPDVVAALAAMIVFAVAAYLLRAIPLELLSALRRVPGYGP